jgi:predicted nuclease of predicted toxin-antitoxin system
MRAAIFPLSARCALGGHDVIAVAELWPRAEDTVVMDRAVRGARILITEDKDFGHLVYAKLRRTGGVMLIRFPAGSRRSLVDSVLNVVETRGARLIGSFTVSQPGRVEPVGGQTPVGRVSAA